MSRRSLTLLLLVLAIVAVAWLALRSPGEPGHPAPPPAEDGPEAGGPPADLEEGEPGEPPPPDGTEPEAGEDGAAPDPHAWVRGRVVEVGGKPVADARVVLTWQYRPVSRAKLESGTGDFYARYARTDDRGRFTIRGKGTLAGHSLLAIAGDRVALLPDLPARDPPVDVGDLVLVPATWLRVVVTSGGEPAVGASVEMRASAPGPALYVLTTREVTDREGTAKFLPLCIEEDWTLFLTVRHRGHAEHETMVRGAEALRGGPIRVDLPTGMRVRGRLVGPDGAPAARVPIRVVRTGDDPGTVRGLSGSTGEDGRFEVTGVPIDGARLAFRAGGRRVPHLSEEVRGVNGRVVDLGEVRLGEVVAIRGAVVDADGAPLAKANVMARPEGTDLGSGWVTTGDDGRFEITHLTRGTYEVIGNRTFRGFGSREARVSGVTPGGGDVTLRIVPGNAVVLRFHPADDPSRSLGLEGGWVSVTPEERGDVRGGGFRGTAPTTLYRVRLEPGAYTLRFQSDGYREVTIEGVVVTADEDTVVDVLLEPE